MEQHGLSQIKGLVFTAQAGRQGCGWKKPRNLHHAGPSGAPGGISVASCLGSASSRTLHPHRAVPTPEPSATDSHAFYPIRRSSESWWKEQSSEEECDFCFLASLTLSFLIWIMGITTAHLSGKGEDYMS